MGSLIVGQYDVLDPSSPVVLLNDRDLGSPVAERTTVARILLDGDVVSGIRSSNRTLKLTLLVRTGTRQGDAGAVANLYATVNQQSWAITWTPQAGMSAVAFDCYRGEISQDWDYNSDNDRFVTLTIPAAPFTRDALPTVLAPPASVPSPVILSALDATTGLTSNPAWTNPYEYGGDFTLDLTSFPGGISPVPAFRGDSIAATMTVDTSTFVAGTGSIRVEQPVVTVTLPASVAGGGDVTFTPFTLAATLSGATDLSSASNFTWSTRTDAPNVPGTGTRLQGLNPLTVGIPAAVQDDPTLATAIVNGTWVLTLFDSSARRSIWLLTEPPTADWAPLTINTLLPPTLQDANFDMTAVLSYRLRCYLFNYRWFALNGTTPELYATVRTTTGEVGANTLNCSTQSQSTPHRGDWLLMIASSTATMETSRSVTVPVTAGQTYSGRCGLRTLPTMRSGFTVPNPPAIDAALTYQCGIEWLNVSAVVISTTYGSVTPGTLTSSFDPRTISGETARYYSAEPVVSAAVAPAGAVTARIRYRVISAQSGQQTYAQAPRIVPGSTAWRYPYSVDPLTPSNPAPVPIARMWLDDVKATAPTTGVVLTTPYGLAPFVNIAGVARTPVSLAVTATSGTPTRMLITRVPNPPARFTPFLDSPSSSPGGTQTDLTNALSGKYNQSSTSSGPVVYTVPAQAYNSTYAVMVRVRTPNTGTPTTTLTVTAGLPGDTVTSVCSVNVALTAAYKWYVAGTLVLPPRALDPANTAQTMTISLSADPSTTHQFGIDLMVLVDLSGEMVLVDGVSATRFWLDSPDSQSFTGTVYAGTAANRSDAKSAAAFQSGQAVMNFDPGYNVVGVLLDNAASSTVALTYFAKWAGESPL